MEQPADYNGAYNCKSVFENIHFLNRVIDCLRGNRTQAETDQVIVQLQDNINSEKRRVQSRYTSMQPMLVNTYVSGDQDIEEKILIEK